MTGLKDLAVRAVHTTVISQSSTGHLKLGTMCRNSFSSSFILASDGMFPELAVYCTNEDPLTSSHFARKSERSESVAPCCISHCSFPRRLSESCEVSLLNMVSIGLACPCTWIEDLKNRVSLWLFIDTKCPLIYFGQFLAILRIFYFGQKFPPFLFRAKCVF